MPGWSYPAGLGESKGNPYWDTILKTSHGTYYVPEKHVDCKHYALYATSSDIIPWYSYSASLDNQKEIYLSYRVKELIWHYL